MIRLCARPVPLLVVGLRTFHFFECLSIFTSSCEPKRVVTVFFHDAPYELTLDTPFSRLVQFAALSEANSSTRFVSTEETSAASSTSTLTSELISLAQRAAMGRGSSVPVFSPMLVVFGIWNLLVQLSFSPWPRVSAPLVGWPFAFPLTTFAPPSLALLCCHV